MHGFDERTWRSIRFVHHCDDYLDVGSRVTHGAVAGY